MSLATLLDKTAAIARRDLLTAVRYRTGFVLGAVGAVTELAAFYYLSRAVGPSFRPDGQDYFSFLLIGTGFYTFLLMGVHAFLQTVQEAQQTGTLEVLMTTSTSPPVLVFLSAISAFTANTFTLGFYLAAGLALFEAPFDANVGAAISVFLLSVVIAGALGLLAAALQIAIQKGSAVVWALGSVWFLTGTMFPVAVLPKPLRYLSAVIPMTHCLDGMRLALLEGAPMGILVKKLAILGLFGTVLVPVGLLVFSWTLRRARLQGTLSFY
jgi:ABC-2 type transport system permease protein